MSEGLNAAGLQGLKAERGMGGATTSQAHEQGRSSYTKQNDLSSKKAEHDSGTKKKDTRQHYESGFRGGVREQKKPLWEKITIRRFNRL